MDGSPGLARKLYDMLVRPIEAKLDGAESVGIVPMGVLSLLPFPALVRHSLDREEYWCERQDIVILSYWNVDHIVRSGSSDQLDLGAATVSVLANPTLDLRHAIEEGEHVMEVFPRAKLYPRGEATPSAMQDAWRASDVLH